MLVLNNEDISALLSLEEILTAVEEAMLANENKACIAPQRMHLDFGANTFLAMPSFSESHYGTKLVSVVPGNAAKQLPVTNGLMLLNDIETGLPLALMNAAKLTALRTGAVGAMGLKYMTDRNTNAIGLIGCGVQGIHQAIFACAVRPIKKIICLFRSAESFEKLKSAVSGYFPHVSVQACSNTEELLQQTNVIIAATTSATPVLPNDKKLLEGKHFISIGSYKPTMQELPDAVYELAGCLAIDSEGARHEVGDIVLPLQKGILNPEDVFTIGQLINGKRKIDISKTTVYKSAGMALFDLFVAQAMYESAKEKNCGKEIII